MKINISLSLHFGHAVEIVYSFKGTHLRYMKFDFCNTEIKNQNGGTDATTLPSSLSAINH